MSSTQNLDGLMKWRCVGPFRGGRIVAVSGSYDDPSTFYFGAVAGGIWKTTDAGSYWTPISDGYLNTSSIGALAVAPSDSNVIYAGTGETTIRIDVTHGDGVYKSTDAGKSWDHIGLEDTRFIGKIRVHPDNPDIVWVAALGHAYGPNKERGVFKSVDGGATWKQVLFVSEKAGAVDITVDANPHILYATIWEAHRKFWQISSGGEDSSIWRSTDGGDTWENITANQGLPKGTLGKIGVSASPARLGPGLGADRAYDRGRRLSLRGSWRHLDQGERQPESRLPRLVLHPHHRRPGRRRYRLRQQSRLLEKLRWRRHLLADSGAARRLPRSLDRPERQSPHDPGATTAAPISRSMAATASARFSISQRRSSTIFP